MWYKNAIFYEVYVRAFKDSNGDGRGDLLGLAEKLDYLQELGITALWLMPIYPSPLKDDGYDIADYYGIHPDYGNLDDFKTLLTEAHQRDIRIILDLVLNHTSNQHKWFQEARKDKNSKYRDYYVWSDDHQKYADARIIFLDTEESNWTWDESAKQYFWHRFYSSQPDLNYDNPAVQAEMLQVMKFWLDLGVDGFRADAVPYLFQREGTNCENLPETHAYLKKIRTYLNENYADRILLSEANQYPKDVLPYFGDGTDEFQMAFHFPLMPRLYMALAKADRAPLEWVMAETPSIPPNTQWCIFLRNHDELTLEMVTEEERQWMWNRYAPDPRMKLNLGIRRRLAPLVGGDLRRIALLNSLLFTLPGTPILYYGDEIGMGDDISLPDRDGVRTPMQWTSENSAGFSSAEQFYAPLISDENYAPKKVNVVAQKAAPNSLFNIIRRMIFLRKKNAIFGHGGFAWVSAPAAVAAYTRQFEGEKMLILNNLSEEEQEFTLEEDYRDILNEKNIKKGIFTLHPYQYFWLSSSRSKGFSS